ncbi:hypothetical protein PCL_05450 [Purpureocillium lilacinum]|uniref:Fido domain-containing protein n=1 Tax=Purpureocillium lilacinum TaxID=33203 RepID=A0A2U3DUP3_PURLI|nr:hypothetical protein PCL_05450 [Purpureocillium lilacinum]
MYLPIAEAISRGWPTGSAPGRPVAVRLGPTDRSLSDDRILANAYASAFKEATTWLKRIRGSWLTDANQEAIMQELHATMAAAVFTSNTVARAGLNWELTQALCRKVWADSDDTSRVITTLSDEAIKGVLMELSQLQPSIMPMSVADALRARNEVVQHAKAYQHILHEFVVNKKDLSEELIKETHRILTLGVPIVEEGRMDIPPEAYGGIYRTVIGRNINYPVPEVVPAHMQYLCEELKREISAAEQGGWVDPFSLATRYALEFVSIIPFEDGNGRMCCMILNAIVCRYVGILVHFGDGEGEWSGYAEMNLHSDLGMTGAEEYALLLLQRSVSHLKALKKKLKGKGDSKLAAVTIKTREGDVVALDV